MPLIKHTSITFTRRSRESLRLAYNAAVADGQEQFTWQGHEFLTDYAKYLLEYLDNNLTD